MNDNRETIDQLRTFFQQQSLPKEIRLNAYSVITDVSRFVEGHLAIANQPDPKNIYEPFVNRLVELKEHLLNNAAAR